jgi:dienelactone hydrolase
LNSPAFATGCPFDAKPIGVEGFSCGALLALQQLTYSLLQCLPVDTSQHKYPIFFYLKEDPVVANP